MDKKIPISSTQKFTEIREIVDDIVVFNNGNACMIIEVSPTNFALLSKEEQDAKINAYASFLNSLSFPIQILVVNKRVDVSSYINKLNDEIKKITAPNIADYMTNYRDFVLHLVKQNVVLDKKFFIAIPYSYSELGSQARVSQATIHASVENILESAKPTLKTKAEGLRNQLSRANLLTKILQRDQLILLFHQFYNSTETQEVHHLPIINQNTI
ncbi:MAG TPA: hypothetical protein VF820_00190 [Patescibacteria group bacterium]